jgi:hypothetical protein
MVKNMMFVSFGIILLPVLFMISGFGLENSFNASANLQNRPIIMVPVAFCPVEGTPAERNPTTDKVLLDRLDRGTVTYLNQAGIVLRSAINMAIHNSTSFPTIPDTNLTIGTMGNITTNDSGGRHIVEEQNECIDVWKKMSIDNTVYGIITINLKQYFWQNGTVQDDLFGISSCNWRHSTDSCHPVLRFVSIIDNYYTMPGFPGPINRDPKDNALAHEIGHGLSLGHRYDRYALMHALQQPQPINLSRMVDNFDLNQTEINKARSMAILVPGAEYASFGGYNLGEIAYAIETDEHENNSSVMPHENLASVSITRNTAKNVTEFNIALFGNLQNDPIPNNHSNSSYLTFVDIDNNPSTGIKGNTSGKFEDSNTNMTGADLVILAEIIQNQQQQQQKSKTGLSSTEVVAWLIDKEGTISEISSPNLLKAQVLKPYIPHILNNGTGNDNEYGNSFSHSSVSITINNTLGLELNNPFTIQTVIYSNGKITDKLNDISTKSETLVLKQPPSYPQCNVKDLDIPGRTAVIEAFDLLPDSKIDVSIGARTISYGTTDNKGNDVIDIKIPKELSDGLHPVTVSVENTAITSNCVIDMGPNSDAK